MSRLTALIMLILASPLLAFISLAILLGDGRPLFFTQERLGLQLKGISIFKFRTMRGGKIFSFFADWLRYTGLDELPQLINIMKGDMNWVGPRPLPIAYKPILTDKEKKRFRVKPGVIGLVQVRGRNGLSWSQKFRYDRFYAENKNYKLDLFLLFSAFKQLINRLKTLSVKSLESQPAADLRAQRS